MVLFSPALEPGQWPRLFRGEFAILIWNHAPVGTRVGVAKLRRETRFDLFAQDVLELAGLVMNLVPGQIEVVGEEALTQAVAAHKTHSGRAALVGEPHSMRLVTKHESLFGEPRQHLRHRGGRQTKLLSQAGYGDSFRALGQLEDRLEVLLATLAALVDFIAEQVQIRFRVSDL